MEDLKFTTAGDYMAWYNSTTEQRYESYVMLAEPEEPVLPFEEWLNS